jgi:anti-anti-sigma regulatory factor
MDRGEPSVDQHRVTTVVSRAPVVCPTRLDVAAAAELRLAVLTQLAVADELALDVGEITYIDAAGVQLLCAATRAAQGKGKGVTWIGTSTALASAARQLGVDQVLGLTGSASRSEL